jgi:5-methyltetrahydrofolate--homocysteine methyltransferase
MISSSMILPHETGMGNPRFLTRFSFPRQPYDDHLALSDYFASVESGKMDVVAFQVVTVGLEATERFERLQAANDYTEAYFTTDSPSRPPKRPPNYLHDHIRRELGIGEKQGKRYSWGYPAIPELEDHRKVFELIACR